MSITLDSAPIDVPPQQRSAWGTGISLAFHLALFGLLLLGPDKDKPKPQPPAAIAVELMTAAQFATLTAPQQTPPSAAPAAPAATASPGSSTTTPAVKSAPAGTIRATQFYAGSVLAEPESAEVRATMNLFY